MIIAQAGTFQADTVSSAKTPIARLYAELIGGASAPPPNQVVVMPVSVLNHYQDMIQELEERSGRYRQIITELLRERDTESGEIEVSPVQMSPSANAVVNSLLATVPDASFYRDDVEEV